MAGLNTAQIIEKARGMGINLSDSDAQPILSKAWDQSQYGADAGKVDSLLQGMRTPVASPSTATAPSNVYTTASNDVTAQNAANKAANDTRFAQNRNDITSAIDSYTKAIPGIQTAAENKYGVNTLLGLTNSLETRINDLKGNVSGTGAGGYASATQVDKAVNTKYLPQYNQAASNLGRAATLANADVTTALDPYKTTISTLTDQIARESTGYTTAQQNELSTLLTKMNNGFTLSEDELKQTYDLAKLDADYANKVKLASSDSSGRYIKLGTGDQVYDTVTGKIIAGSSVSGKNNSAGV